MESVGFCPKGRTGMPFFGKRSLPYRDRPLCEKGAAVSYRGTTTNGDTDIPRRSELLLFYCEENLYEKLLRRGILIRDCSNFEGLSQGYYRIAVKRHEENLQLLEEIKECLKP